MTIILTRQSWRISSLDLTLRLWGRKTKTARLNLFSQTRVWTELSSMTFGLVQQRVSLELMCIGFYLLFDIGWKPSKLQIMLNCRLSAGMSGLLLSFEVKWYYYYNFNDENDDDDDDDDDDDENDEEMIKLLWLQLTSIIIIN